MSDMFSILRISGAGMKTQDDRTRIIAQNLANADTPPDSATDDPYRRQIITFKNVLDKASGERIVTVNKVEKDNKDEFAEKYMPGHPAADENGYVKMPNVNSLIEVMDMKEASRSYQANLGMFTQTRDMYNRTIDIIR